MDGATMDGAKSRKYDLNQFFFQGSLFNVFPKFRFPGAGHFLLEPAPLSIKNVTAFEQPFPAV